MNKSIGRGFPRWFFGLALGITLVLGLVPGIRTRVALAEDPTYTITVTIENDPQTKQNITTDGQLDTYYTYTGSLPSNWGGFDGVTNAASAEAGTYHASGATFTISLKCTNVCSGEHITIHGHDINANDYTFDLIVNCTENTAVTIDPATTSLDVKGTTKLTATVTPVASAQQGVTWSSSDTSVATVSTDGTVTGIKAGKATITATSVADTTKTATCEVTVNAVPVTGVELNKTTASVEAGKTDELKATVRPDNATDKTVTWKSSDESIATVDKDGKITGVKAGTAKITATTNDGKKTATCDVTVTEPAITYAPDQDSARVTWTQGSKDGPLFTFVRSVDNAKAYDHFTSLSIGSKVLEKDKDYTAVSGSVKATISPDLLNDLDAGEYTVTATFDDGAATATLTVEESSAYTIRFDANGGTGTMDSLVVEKDATTKLPKNTFTRPGYKFVEWNREKDGSGASYPDEDRVSVHVNATLYAQWKIGDYPAPEMSNSRGGTITSTSEEITFTVNQGVPDYAKSFVTWVDLEDVFSFSSDEVEVTTTEGDTVGSDVAKVSIDGQRLTITVDDATSLLGKTLQVSYKAKLKSGASLSSYASNGIASVPYQAHTIFDGNESDVKSSEVEYVKFRVSSGSTSKTTTTAKTPTTSTKSSTLAKTGDPTSLAGAATLAAAGAVAIFAGRRKK